MRYLIDGFHDHTIDSWRPTITPYIFWQPVQPLRREKGKAQQAFLRALLCQILAQMPKASLDGLCLQNPTSPCLEDLWEFDPHEFQACLRTLLYAITNVTRVCLFVDALDECGDDAQEILSYLEQLSVRPDLLQRLRVFVSSRSAPAETQEFVMNTIWVDQENASDIAAFTEAQLSALITPQNSRKQSDMLACGKTDEVLKQIVETITQRAQGIFLWVHLAIRTLEAEFLSLAYPSLWFLQEAASRLPTEINVLYDGLIKGISTSHQVMAQKVLTWVSCTVRPLSTDELYTALQLTHQTRDAEFVGYKDLDLVSWVIPMCGGLVELVSTPFSQSRYVQFIHSSAKEFCVGPGAQLLSPKAKSSEDAVARAHDSISHVCLDYLLQAQCRPKGLVKYDIPFLNYSLSNWAYHLHASIRHKSPPQSYLLDAFMFSHRSSKLGKVCYFTPARNSSTSHTSMLHVLSQYGIINAVRVCLKGSYTELQQLEDSCVCRRTSLQLAIRGEHTGVVKLLLDHGANLNSRDQFGSTPLHAAVISGYESMVELLLERGADFTCTDAKGITPLLCATKKGHVQITQLLLKWAADLNISNSCRGSLISLAAGRGHQSILEVFFKRWSISHTSSWSSGTILGVTLVVAAAAGHAKVVRWLLQSNLFDTLEDNIIQQGFIASIVRGHIDIVKIFFEFGCHPDIHDNQHGQSALALAAAGGHSLVVDYLLQHGADANISDRQTGNTPLVYAVGGGFLAIVRLLLAKGARIDLVGRSSLFAKASWRTRILTALTLECARDKPGVVTTFGLGQGSSEGSVWGSADENHGARKGSGPDRKRARGEEKSGQDGPNDGDDARGNKRHCKNKTGSSLSNEREWACPFQKAFPSEHECGALRDVSRIK
jgi:ankyrin repeat protein